LYDVGAPETAVLTRRLGALTAVADGWVLAPVEPVYALPEGMEGEETAVFGDMIALAGYTVARQDNSLTLTLVWRALRDGATDYTRFVHLVDPTGSQPPVAQDDSFPVFNTYPTGQWVAGGVITDVVVLDVAQVPAGDYQLLVGFYGKEGRVTAVDENGVPFPNNAVPLK